MPDDLESRQRKTLAKVPDAYYRHLCEHAGVSLISAGTDLMIQTFNPAASRMFGASASSMIGTPIGSVIPNEDREKGERLMLEAIEKRIIVNFEFSQRDDLGRPCNLIATFSPIIDDSGTHIGALACIRDITRRITLESDLAQRNKMASLGQMAGALAHHFNNILGGAVTSVDFSLSTDNPAAHARTLRQIGEVLARATKLLNALLTFAEGDFRHQDECDLTEVVIDVARYMEPELDSQNIKLELKLDPVPVTPVPRAQLITVLENILHNAADAMPDGGEAIIESSIRDGVVVLAISDNGCGMDEAACQRAFEPFYSTKTSGMDLERHPGLGLAVAHGVLQVLGHTVSVASKVGEGTTVSIKFTGDSARMS